MTQIGILSLSAIWVIFLIAYAIPNYKNWLKNRMKRNTYHFELKKLLKIKKETTFHLQWAQQRGDPVDDYINDLQKIEKSIKNMSSTLTL